MLEPSGPAAPWREQSAWEPFSDGIGRVGNPDGAPGVILRPLPVIAMATIIVRPTARSAFDEAVRAHWGFAPPDQRRASFGPEGDMIWSAPNQWLAIGGPAEDGDGLAADLGGMAAVSEQGDGRACVEIDGPFARDTLSKLISIDLHPQTFTPGSAAVTAFAHLSVQLWCKGDGALTLCVPRTVTGSVWSALLAAAAPYGCVTNTYGKRNSSGLS